MTNTCATKCAIHSGSAIIVTDAGRDSVTLRKLARRAICMLIYPTAFSAEDRESVADAISEALGPTADIDLSEAP